MKIEWWKYIPGYEGLYMASNLGRIKSVSHIVKARNAVMDCHVNRCTKSTLLKPKITRGGYQQVRLYKDGVGKWVSVHRLVALTWLENPDNLPCVDHIDTNRENNCVSNLRWVTHKENANNTKTLNKKRNNNRSKKVNQLTLDGELVRVWPSVNEITRQTGWSQGNISNCCRGESKYVYGYVWRYAV